MLALIDFDTPAYASAVMAEGQGENIAVWNANDAVEKKLKELNTNEFQLYLTGGGNFRYNIYPEYKANRPPERPTHLKAVKEHLVREWGAVLAEGCEADDLIGVDATLADLHEREVIIVHIDKDINQIPGLHYKWEQRGKSKGKEWVVPAKRYHVSPLEGLRFFYEQLLIGDVADNIIGVRGIGPKRVGKYLDHLTDEKDMYEAVLAEYDSEERLIMNGQCLWIWKKMGEIWQPPGQKQENTDS
jgi:DNA polymerase-1